MSQKSQSPLDSEPYFSFIKEQILAGETNTSIVIVLAIELDCVTSESSIKRFRKRHELQIPGTEKAYTNVTGDTAEGLTEPVTVRPVLDDPDTMLRDRGLDPTDWYIDSVGVNEWDGPKAGGSVVTYYQLKFQAKRKKPQRIVPPRTEGWTAPLNLRSKPASVKKRRLIVVVGDQQAPYQDPKLHELFCQWLEHNVPEDGVSLGDSYDFPDISRHPDDPENDAAINECLQSGYDMFRGYVNASPYTRWQKLIGNHDERIRTLLLKDKDARKLYGLKRPDTPEERGELVLELSHLGRLDELGIEIVWPHGGYKLGQIVLSDKLAVRHGWLTPKGAGASALASLKHLGYSVIVGHTHRQSLVHETKAEITGKTQTLVGVETGCMCRIEQTADENGRIWPSYVPSPDWQQGFATVEMWEDGSFKVDLATYVNGTLLYRNQRYV